MIADTSALVAILLEEPDFTKYVEALAGASPPRLSAATFVEFGVVIDRKRDPRLVRRVDDLIAALGMVIEPLTEQQARIAREAYRDYGKGSGHVFNLGHGITPEVDPAHAGAFFEAVHELSAQYHG